MTQSTWDRIKEYTEQRINDPRPGDHFTEMLGSVALVRWRLGPFVFVSFPNEKRNGWGKPKGMLVSQFKRWASYGSIPGYWCEIYPPTLTDSAGEKHE